MDDSLRDDSLRDDSMADEFKVQLRGGVEMSTDQEKLAKALSKAQAAFPPIPRDKEVQVQPRQRPDGTWPAKYKFRYAPLDTILGCVRKPLGDNGLALIQEISGNKNGRFLTTTLLHESGQWRSSTHPLPGKANTNQEFGGEVTYARRYTTQCVLMVAAEEDADGNDADGNEWEPVERPRSQGKPPQQEQERPRGRQRPPSTDKPAEAVDHPLAQKLRDAKFPSPERWGLQFVNNGNPRTWTDEHLAVLGPLGEAWIAGGDDAHAKEADKLKAAGLLPWKKGAK